MQGAPVWSASVLVQRPLRTRRAVAAASLGRRIVAPFCSREWTKVLRERLAPARKRQVETETSRCTEVPRVVRVPHRGVEHLSEDRGRDGAKNGLNHGLSTIDVLQRGRSLREKKTGLGFRNVPGEPDTLSFFFCVSYEHFLHARALEAP